MRLVATLALAALLLAPAALAQSVTAHPAAEAHAAVAGPAFDTARIAVDTLYNQLDRGGSRSGLFLSENFEAANDGADSYLADDFVVPAGATWTVGKVIASAFYFRDGEEPAAVPNETFNVVLWADLEGRPDAEVFRADDVVPSSNTAGDQVLGFVELPIGDEVGGPVELAAGTYWLTVQANVDFTANETRFLWATTNVDRALLGELAHLFNYGGGFTSIGPCNTTWGEAVTAECDRTDDGDNGNLAFAILSADDGSAIAIADARAQGIGATVTVEGTVSRAEGDFTYFQDETGGLTLRQTSGDVFDEVAASTIRTGTTLRVTGTLTEFNGLLQISNADLASYEVLGQGDAPAAQAVTLAELASNGEAYEAELVTVGDLTFADLASGAAFEARTTYQVTDPSDATNAVTVRVPNADDSTIDGTEFVGSPATITGPVGQFSSTDPAAGYQIFLVEVGDVTSAAVAVGESPDGRLALAAAQPNPAAREASLTVSLASAGRATLVVYDALGREVARALDRDLAAGEVEVRLDVSALPAGTYLARLTANGGVAVRPFTVVR